MRQPIASGLKVAQSAQQYHPSATILFLTGSSDFVGLPVEEQVGHFAYMLKTSSPQEVLERVAALLAVSSGDEPATG